MINTVIKVVRGLESRFGRGRIALGIATVTSAANMLAGIGLQVVLPPTLLSKWGDGGYALYVAVTGFAAYLGLADAGVQIFLTQRLTMLRGSRDSERTARMARGGLRALTFLGIAGLVVVTAVFLWFGARITSRVSGAAHVTTAHVLAALVVQLVSGAIALATGGWSTAVEQATGHYARTPGVAAARTATLAVAITTSALVGVGPIGGMVVGALAMMPIDLVRFVIARRLIEMAPRGDSVIEILRSASGSLLMMIAWSTQSGLYPAVAASVAPEAATVAIPGRTVSNMARFLSTAAQNVLWTPIAARLAGERTHDGAYSFWKRNSPVLVWVQLLGMLALVAGAPIVVPHWLPHKSDGILALLPIYCVEQGILVASMPSQVLLTATGAFRTMGVTQLVAAAITLTFTIVEMPRIGPLGFAAATAVATAVCTAPAFLFAEWRVWRQRRQRPGKFLLARVGIALGAASTSFIVRRWPVAAVIYLALLLAFAVAWSRRRNDSRQTRGDAR